jgi:hypothetical protein
MKDHDVSYMAKRILGELGLGFENVDLVKSVIKDCLGNGIQISWCVGDILQHAKDNNHEITAEDAANILEIVEDEHDPMVGINWEVIQTHMEDYLASKKFYGPNEDLFALDHDVVGGCHND